MPRKKLTYLDFLHAVRAAGNVAEENRIIVFGSNAIIPWLNQSMNIETSEDIDITFFDDENEMKTTDVDGALGESSLFHKTFGF